MGRLFRPELSFARKKFLPAAQIRHGILLCVLVAASTVASFGQPTTPFAAKADERSCRAFVQEFYDWYTPIAASEKYRLTVSLRTRRLSFDPELWRMLVADDTAQSKADEIVGLDFDPILNTQDPSSKFVVKRASVKSGRCNAAVVGMNQGVEDEHVAPELILSNGRWVFVNFHYQSWVTGKLERSGDLVRALKYGAKERARLAKEKSE